jgi:hypothetical protein
VLSSPLLYDALEKGMPLDSTKHALCIVNLTGYVEEVGIAVGAHAWAVLCKLARLT